MSSSNSELYDLIIIGAGPNGLSCAIEARAKGLSYLVVDRGTIAESIRRFPSTMTFFSTPELLELGSVPFTSPSLRPTRQEALVYYRRVVQHFNLTLRLHCEVTGISRQENIFTLTTRQQEIIQCRSLVVATGYFDTPNSLGIPGESLPHVSHYYQEPFRYFGASVVIVGAENSAVDAALELFRHGSRVTLVHRGTDIGTSVKYWVRPDIKNRIKERSIEALFSTQVEEITERDLGLRNLETGEAYRKHADFVFLLTGYRPDVGLLRQLQISINSETIIPKYNPRTYETDVPDVYVAGSIVCGCETGNVFIENGRHHAIGIVQNILEKRQ